MDSVTQIALGAAVGEATLGRKVGWRAPFWGGLCGLLPDFDVLWPFADPVAAFTWHRGYSHALAVLTLATPLIAWAAVRIHPATRQFRRGWLLLAFLALVTHPILDCFTVYGTQALLPFSDLPVAWSTIFIIDPLFSLPLLLGVTAALVLTRGRALGHWLSNAGLALAVAWLAFTVAIKVHVDRVTENSLPSAGVTRYLTTPSPFNAVLWRVVAMTDDGRYLEGYYSLLDAERKVAFASRPAGHELLEPLRHEALVARLMWFSRGFFAGRELDDGKIMISDLRMGFEDWFVFSFAVGRREGQTIAPAPVQRRPAPDFPAGMVARLWDRILGRSPHPACIAPCGQAEARRGTTAAVRLLRRAA